MTTLFVAPAAKQHRLADSIPGLLKSLKIPSQTPRNPQLNTTDAPFARPGRLNAILVAVGIGNYFSVPTVQV
jgi:hypothetical protein